MTLLGLDFDNTLVRYDNLFHKLALEKNLIPESVHANKTAIRDYLRSQGNDELFTLLQGEVYGPRILEAKPAEGVLEALKTIRHIGIPMVLISHKTKTPYKGPKYDLHKAALNWLEMHGFLSSEELGWSQKNIYFEESKAAKINRINELSCTHYIDDLPEILDMIPRPIKAILYDPCNTCHANNHPKITHWSEAKKAVFD